MDVAGIKEEIFNKYQSDGDRDLDLNPVGFHGNIVNKELHPKSADEAIRYNNWYEAMKWEQNAVLSSWTENLETG